MASKTKSTKKSSKRKREEEEENNSSDDDFVKETIVKKRRKEGKRKHKKRKSSVSSAEEDQEMVPPSPKRNHLEEEREEREEEKGEEEQKTSQWKVPTLNVHKPARTYGWLFHIAAVAITSCLKHCQRESIDIRGDTDSIDWSHVASTSFTSSDIQKLWYFIGKQYPNESISNIMDLLSQFATVSRYDLAKEQYKKDMPKQPLSSFMLFYGKKRSKLVKKYPDLPQPLIAKKLGEMWKKMSPRKKAKYERLYEANKENYHEQMKAYRLQHPETAPPPVIKKVATKVPVQCPVTINDIDDEMFKGKSLKQLKQLAPRKPIGGYLIFCKEKRPVIHKEYPDLLPVEITKKLGECWKGLSDNEKAKYKKVNDRDKERYEEEIADFWISHPTVATLLKIKKPQKTQPKPKTKAVVNSSNSDSEGDGGQGGESSHEED